MRCDQRPQIRQCLWALVPLPQSIWLGDVQPRYPEQALTYPDTTPREHAQEEQRTPGGREGDHRCCVLVNLGGVPLPRPSSPYSKFSCSAGGCSTRMAQEMSGIGSASSRDTHNTSCSFPAGGRNPTFCQRERVCHRWPGCLPALPPLPGWEVGNSHYAGPSTHLQRVHQTPVVSCCMQRHSRINTHPFLLSF